MERTSDGMAEMMKGGEAWGGGSRGDTSSRVSADTDAVSVSEMREK